MENMLALETKSFVKTDRVDPWWIEWALLGSALTVFLLYGMWAVFQGKDYAFGPYRSPFYPFDIHLGNLSPALLVFWIPVSFRLTCYYSRKVYYRVYGMKPPGCMVGSPDKGYTGETKFPFIILNIHRYTAYLAFLLMLIHWKETMHVFYYNGSLGIGLGGVLILADSIFLSLYVFSCHSIRHVFSPKASRFSCSAPSKAKYGAYRGLSVLNLRHGLWAWLSLTSIILADLYIRLLCSGSVTDINTWGAIK